MEGIPILDYTPATLLGIMILLLLLGKGIVPESSLKMYIEENKYLRSALEKSQESEAQALEALAVSQKSSEVTERFFSKLEREIPS